MALKGNEYMVKGHVGELRKTLEDIDAVLQLDRHVAVPKFLVQQPSVPKPAPL